MKWFFRRKNGLPKDADASDMQANLIAGRLLGLQLRLSGWLEKVALKVGHRRAAFIVVMVCVCGLVYCLYLVLRGFVGYGF